MPTTVTTSTSVVLVATAANTPPYIVLLPNISTVGRLITVRDNDGFASAANNILLSTTAGAIFSDGTNTLAINQPYAFVTLNTNPNGVYYLLNTFAFPAGQAAANVSNLTASSITTRQIFFTDIGTPSTNVIYTSSSILYLNSTAVGEVTASNLTSTVNGLGSSGYLSSLAAVSPSVWVAVGDPSSIIVGSKAGSVQYSTDSFTWVNALGGFFKYGTSVAYGDGLFVAVGNNDDGAGPNLGYNQWSIDGSNWNNSTTPTMAFDQSRNQVNYNNGLWHSVGANPYGGPRTIQWSTDGKTWNDTTGYPQGGGYPFPSGYGISGFATGITYGNGVWVVSGRCESVPGAGILWSSDGSNWSNATSVSWTGSYINGVAFNGSRFVCIPFDGTNPSSLNIAYSTDGKGWSSSGITGGNLNNGAGQVSGNGDIWLITSGGGAPNQGRYLIYSTDALTWNSTTTFSACNDTTRLTDPYYDGATWWVGLSNDSDSQAIFYSGNGISWSKTGVTSGFISSGVPNNFSVKPGQSNNNILLVSAITGVFQQISTSVTTNVLTASTLNATSISAATMIVSSLFINVTTVSTTNETINNISTQNVDFLSVGITVGRTAFFSSLSSTYISTSQLWAGSGNFSTLNVNTISSGLINVSTIAMVTNVKITGAASSAIAIGTNAGNTSQGSSAVAIGYYAGFTGQVADAVAIGSYAGSNLQQVKAVAIGAFAGQILQSNSAVAIGESAGFSNQGVRTVAVGFVAGCYGQGDSAVAIGLNSGNSNQGINAVAIGNSAGQTNQSTNTIVLNASGVALNTTLSNAFFVKPIRYAAPNGTSTLFYTATTGEITYGPSVSSFVTLNTGTLNANTISSGIISVSRIDMTAGVSITATSGTVAIGCNAGATTQQANAIAIGGNGPFTGAGQFTQGNSAVAIGISAGNSSQQTSAVAIGGNAGSISQGNSAVAIGSSAGGNTQGGSAVAIGGSAGTTTQGSSAVAIGLSAGRQSQSTSAVAIGENAGYQSQGICAIAIGSNAGSNVQGNSAIAIGILAARSSQGINGIAIGSNAGGESQGTNAIAIGESAGVEDFIGRAQSTNAIAIGKNAGKGYQGPNAIAIGEGSGGYNNNISFTGQGSNAVAIGTFAGSNQQGISGLAIGFQAGQSNQGTNAVAIGREAGESNQGTNSIAIGYLAGLSTQGNSALAIGFGAGRLTQGLFTVAVGLQAGESNQASSSVAVGTNAGRSNQQTNAVAVGNAAGNFTQGAYAVAIGSSAGVTNQAQSSIVINATGSALDNTISGTFCVKPVRTQTFPTGQTLGYNSTTGEIVYGVPSSDRRIKKNIETANLNMCYSTMRSLPLKYFEWNFPIISTVVTTFSTIRELDENASTISEIVSTFIISTNISTDVQDKRSLGYIAQDVEMIFPKSIFKVDQYGYDDFKGLDTDQILKMHYGATQKSMEIIDTQSTLIGQLEGQVSTINFYTAPMYSTIETQSTLIGQLEGQVSTINSSTAPIYTIIETQSTLIGQLQEQVISLINQNPP